MTTILRCLKTKTLFTYRVSIKTCGIKYIKNILSDFAIYKTNQRWTPVCKNHQRYQMPVWKILENCPTEWKSKFYPFTGGRLPNKINQKLILWLCHFQTKSTPNLKLSLMRTENLTFSIYKTQTKARPAKNNFQLCNLRSKSKLNSGLQKPSQK